MSKYLRKPVESTAANYPIRLGAELNDPSKADGKDFTGAITTKVGAGVVPVTGAICKITTNGVGNALTLADGILGQRLYLIHAVEGGASDTAVITPAHFGNGTTITFDGVGDACELLFDGTEWWVVANNGASIA